MHRTTFRLHSLRRLQERTSLEPQEVAQFIDGGKSVLLGREDKIRRVHHLFYSEKDDATFVAVWDEETEEVITILPMSYHHAWFISLEAQQEAKQLILEDRCARVDPFVARVHKYQFRIDPVKKAAAIASLLTGHPPQWTQLLFVAHFSYGPHMKGYGRQRKIPILSTHGSPRCPSVAAYISDKGMRESIQEKILGELRPKSPSYLELVTVRIGRGATICLGA